MGEVYEARHRVLGRRFAVKLLHPELVRSGRMLRRFSRESLSASRIESDHVVAVVDCGHLPDGAPYFVMDYLRGQDLRKVLLDVDQLPVPRAVRLIIQVCRGLGAAHELGLVHRDLKPENIFLERKDDGRECAKILDFGVVQTNGGNSTAQAGALIGTLKYMAPEQARGDARLDQRADLYALGAILYECLAGVVPHPGQNTEEVLFHIMSQEPIPLLELRPRLDPGLVGVIARCLERQLDKRFQSAAELAAALLPYAGDGPTQLTEVIRHGHDTSADETLAEASAKAAFAQTPPSHAQSSPIGGLAKKRWRWIAIAALCGLALHFVDRAWLLRARPLDSQVPAIALIAPTAPSPPVAPTPSATPPTAQGNPAPVPTSQPTESAQPSPSPAAKAPHGAASATRPLRKIARANEPPQPDGYGANLDWKNPYGVGGAAKQ